MALAAIPCPGEPGRPEETRRSECPRARRPGGRQPQQAGRPLGHLASDDAFPPVVSKLRRRRYDREDRRRSWETPVGVTCAAGRYVQEKTIGSAIWRRLAHSSQRTHPHEVEVLAHGWYH